MTRKKKLAIIVASPLTENIYQRIGADQFDEMEVAVFDCLHWIRKTNDIPAFISTSKNNILEIGNVEAFSRAMTAFQPDYLLDFVGRGAMTKIIQMECHRTGTLYITHHLSPFPTVLSRSSAGKSLLLHPLRTIKKAWGVCKRILAGANPFPPDISLLAGARSANPWLMSAKRVVHAATPAYYDIIACAKNGNSPQKEEYILFIDDCLPLSFDFLLGSFKPIMAPEEYFPMMNQFFSRLERLFGLPVVIAAHPNGEEYPDYAGLFAGRRVEFGQSAALSFGCLFAMTHYSSAINYPIILKKPVNTITFEALKKSLHGPSVDYIGSLLQRVPVDLTARPDDALLKSIFLAPVNQAAYERYQRDYIVNTAAPGANPFDNLQQYLLSLP